MDCLCRYGLATLTTMMLIGFPSSARAQTPNPVQPGESRASQDDPVSLQTPPAPFWTARHALLFGGIGFSAAAAALAWSQDRQLRADKRALDALPAGSTDEWNREFTNATAVLKVRDFWRGVAIGVGGVTVAYWIFSASIGTSRAAPTSARSSSRRKRSWAVQIDPLAARASVTRTF